MFDVLRRALYLITSQLDAGARAYVSGTAANVTETHAQLRLAGEACLEAVLILAADEEDERDLTLDFSGLPWQVEQVRCSAADPVIRTFRGGLAYLNLAHGKNWNGAELSIRTCWTPTSDSPNTQAQVFVAPDHLPIIRSPSVATGGDMARITVANLDGTAFDLLGIQDGPHYSENGPWLQVALLPKGIRGPSICSGPVSDIYLSARLYEQLDKTSRDRLQHAVKTAHGLLVRQLKVEPPGQFLLTAEDERLSFNASGSLMALTPNTAELLRSGEYPELILYNASLKLIRLWWAGGCRVAGPEGRLLESGLVTGIAIHLVRSLGYGDGLAKIIARFTSYAGGRDLNSVQDASVAMQAPQMAKWALGVANALDAGQSDSFALLTTDQWGRVCSPDLIVDALKLEDHIKKTF